MVNKPPVGKTVVSKKSPVGKNRSTVGNCVDDRVGNGMGLRVGSNAGVLNSGNVSSQVVGVVCDSLDPAVGKRDGVGATDNTVGIAGLSSVEVGLGVVIGNTVGVGVRLRGLLDNNSGCVVSRGSVDYGSVGRGGMHHMVDGSGVDSVDKRCVDCMDKRCMHCVVSVADAMCNMGDMGHLGACQTEEGRDHEGLKFGH